MLKTIDLLNEALKNHPAPYWHKKLGLHRTTLNTAKQRGQLSPSVAYSIAEEMGKDAETWALIAATESERESACKDRMKKSLARRLSFSIGGNERIRTLGGFFDLSAAGPMLKQKMMSLSGFFSPVLYARHEDVGLVTR